MGNTVGATLIDGIINDKLFRYIAILAGFIQLRRTKKTIDVSTFYGNVFLYYKI